MINREINRHIGWFFEHCPSLVVLVSGVNEEEMESSEVSGVWCLVGAREDNDIEVVSSAGRKRCRWDLWFAVGVLAVPPRPNTLDGWMAVQTIANQCGLYSHDSVHKPAYWYISGEEFSFCMYWFCLLHTRSRESIENPILSGARYFLCFFLFVFTCGYIYATRLYLHVLLSLNILQWILYFLYYKAWIL
jgi:hypothetical protein